MKKDMLIFFLNCINLHFTIINFFKIEQFVQLSEMHIKHI